MKLTSFTLFFYILTLLFKPAFALELKPQQAWQAPLASQSLLLDITAVGDKHLVAVGEYGHILLSDKNKQWQQVSVPTQATLTAVFFLNDTLGWAVGHDGTILHSANGGVSWQLQLALPTLEKPFFDIVFKDPLNGVAVGAYGLFFKTSDGGKNWQQVFHLSLLHPDDIAYLNELKAEDESAFLEEQASILPHFNRLYLDGNTLYMVGELGLIAKSNDFGVSWEKMAEVYHGSLFDLIRTQQGNLLITGLRGHIFRSTNNGFPWQAINSQTTSLLNSVVLTDDKRIIVLGNNGLVLVSDDDAETFTLHKQPDGKSLISGVWFNQQLVVVSDVGIKYIPLSNNF